MKEHIATTFDDDGHYRGWMCDCGYTSSTGDRERDREDMSRHMGEVATNPIDPYNVTIGGVKADPYRIAREYGITDPVIFQALKKLLRCGRKHKDMATDVREAITSLERWEEMEKQ